MPLKAREIVEAAGQVAVLAGLLLVAYQINQATEIATAQARADYSSGWRAVDSTRQSDHFSAIMAKSIYQPDQLEPGEILELDAYYTGVMDQIQSAKVNWETGIRASHWQVSVQFLAPSYFGNEFARRWWKMARIGYAKGEGEEFVRIIDAAIEASDPDYQKKLIETLQRPE